MPTTENTNSTPKSRNDHFHETVNYLLTLPSARAELNYILQHLNCQGFEIFYNQLRDNNDECVCTAKIWLPKFMIDGNEPKFM
jgi:hypothetical protein